MCIDMGRLRGSWPPRRAYPNDHTQTRPRLQRAPFTTPNGAFARMEPTNEAQTVRIEANRATSLTRAHFALAANVSEISRGRGRVIARERHINPENT